MSHLSLETVDTDGAIREAAEAVGIDRRNFLRNGAVAGGGLVAGGAFFGILTPAEARISNKRSKGNDVKILQFAMTLELLEATFYREARENNVAGDNASLARFVQVVAAHEDDHVTFLRNALGSKRVKGLKFDFGEAVTKRDVFQKTAQVLEDTGVQAYLGQAPNIAQRPVLKAAASVATVEARHAAWIRTINGALEPDTKTAGLPAPRTFDRPASEAAILKAVKGTGFIQS